MKKFKFDMLDTPYAATHKEWGEWRARTKKERPIRWFLQKTLWNNVIVFPYRRLKYRLTNLKWAILHRFHPKHQYHLVKTGLKPGYYDADTQILHAMFKTVSDFYIHQVKSGFVDWSASPQHTHAFSEMKAIHEWWTVTRPEMEKRVDELSSCTFKDERLNANFFDIFEPENENHPEVISYHKRLKEVRQIESDIDTTDRDMLHRIVDIRGYLWD